MDMRFLCIVIGYLCGCFLTADAVARHKTGKSAFAIGTGNPGMANILEQFGVKWAAATLLGDVLKTVLPCLLCRYLLFKSPGSIGNPLCGLRRRPRPRISILAQISGRQKRRCHLYVYRAVFPRVGTACQSGRALHRCLDGISGVWRFVDSYPISDSGFSGFRA